jgi:hypothetical protein
VETGLAAERVCTVASEALPACLTVQWYPRLRSGDPGFAYGGLGLVDLTTLTDHQWHVAGGVYLRLKEEGHDPAALAAVQHYTATRSAEDKHYSDTEMAHFLHELMFKLEKASLLAGDTIYGIVRDPPEGVPLTDEQIVIGTRQHRLRTFMGPLSFATLVNPRRCVLNPETFPRLVAHLAGLATRRWAYDLAITKGEPSVEMFNALCAAHHTNGLAENRLAVEMLATMLYADTSTRYYCLDIKHKEEKDALSDIYDSPLNSVKGADCEDDGLYSLLLAAHIHDSLGESATLRGLVSLMHEYVFMYVVVTATSPKPDDADRAAKKGLTVFTVNHATLIALHRKAYDHATGRKPTTAATLRELAQTHLLAFVVEGTCDRRAALSLQTDFTPTENARRFYSQCALGTGKEVKFIDHEMDAYVPIKGAATEDAFYHTASLAWALDLAEPQATRTPRHFRFKYDLARAGERVLGIPWDHLKSPEGLSAVILEPAAMDSDECQIFDQLSRHAELLLPPEPEAPMPTEKPENLAINAAATRTAAELARKSQAYALVRFWFRADDVYINESRAVKEIGATLTSAAASAGRVVSTVLHEEPSEGNCRRLWSFYVPLAPNGAAAAGPSYT